MGELKNWQNFLDTINKKGGLAEILDEVKYLGAYSLSMDYNHPKYFKSLKPYESAILMINEDGHVIVCDYNSLQPKRAFSVPPGHIVEIENDRIYLLSEVIMPDLHSLI